MPILDRRQFLQGAALMAAVPARQAHYLEVAERLKPRLHVTPADPVNIVRPAADSSQFLGWRMEKVSPAAALRDQLMRRGDSAVLDFARHLTGHLTFAIAGEGRGLDSPARLKLTFAEVPPEVAEPFDPYHGGLSRAWLQDETINIDVLPATVELPRRYAFRFVKIEVIDTSPNYAVRFDHVRATALSSAIGNPQPLAPSASRLQQQIDAVSIATLRDCMQTVFEDGPKRDRRLWIGDLRLQALTNYAAFRNFDLVKRCLYLFAAFPREDGFVAACAFENPQPHRGHEYIIDYAALYAAAVLDYARASNDWAAAQELWPVVRRQMEILSGYVSSDGLFAAPAHTWVFIDWSNALDHTAAMHGVFVYSLRQALALARKVGDSPAATDYARRIDQMTGAGRAAFYDSAQRLSVSGPKRQISWASQAWMVLSGILSREESIAAFRALDEVPDAVRPGAPYLYHYVADAMLQCGLRQQALALIESYWGGMVKAGADTFWEVYDPSNARLSPYGNVLVNSYCHAWSCTPAHLLRL
jgi:alpha-L-rhamnosidase